MFIDQHGKSEDIPLVLIHGAGGTHRDWAPASSMLPGVRVLVPDLPDHGQSQQSYIPLSPRPGQPPSVPEPVRNRFKGFASQILDMLDDFGIERAFIGGYSMGGAVALGLALDHPDRVRGLILVNTGARLAVHPDLLDKLLRDRETAAKILVDWMWSPNTEAAQRQANRESLLATSPLVLHADFLACDQFDVRDRLHEITCPTLILGGSADKMTPAKYAAFLHDKIGGSTLDVIPDASHKWIMEQPAQAAQRIGAWIAQQG
ncbi:MAG: alpha/beta fold hydrolase [Anaerolineae bacterium]